MRIELKKGFLDISPEVITTISGYTASGCFGVRGMAPASVSDGLDTLFKKDPVSRGVRVFVESDDSVTIELHIIVRHGINISTVSRSVMSEVRYVVENLTGVKVKNIDICVDYIMTD